MKISYNWLKEYVEVKNSVKQVAQWLTMIGLEVTSVEEKDKDAVLEIEVTTNRPDWLSVIGVARELSAVTGKRLKTPKLPNILPVIVREKQIQVEVHDKLLCPRYTARIIDNVRVGPSPEWLRERLEAIGVRSINNVVDITNFCLFELGQPLHAFDYDKLIGRCVMVRRARKGEKIVTIDRVERELDHHMLVIADEKHPVAVAGVMGGLDTEVSEATTKTVLLESAYFDPISIRRTQRGLGLSSDSSYRFERGVDLEGVLFASDRAARLMAQECGGKIGIVKDVGTKVAKPNVIKLSMNKVNRILNVGLSPLAAKKIMVNLGLRVSGAQEELRVGVPSWRKDLEREEDLIEELARIHGYDKIPTTIPQMVGHTDRIGLSRRIEQRAREVLIAQGLDEVLNYSLIDRKDLKTVQLVDDTAIISIKNPLSSQQEVMRPNLLCGMLKVARHNFNRKVDDVGIFELSNVYIRLAAGDQYHEYPHLSILMSGGADFFNLKGILEILFEKLGVQGVEFASGGPGIVNAGSAAKIIIQGEEVGFMGEAARDVLAAFDIKQKVYLCEMRFAQCLKYVAVDKRFAGPPKFLPTKRDISLVVEKGVHVKDLLAAIREGGGAILKSAALIDEYFGAQIPAGKRGLTFSLEYLSDERQLTETEIEKAHSSIREALVNRFAASLR